MISKNKYGCSEISNKVGIVPVKNSKLSFDKKEKEGYDDSLKNIYEKKGIDYLTQKKKYEQGVVYNELNVPNVTISFDCVQAAVLEDVL